ncbi:efflux RND transporter periplasmic adaptor subunit, partial [Sphingomonas sp. NPDC019816]|uniref:efflux RND transporter periplasmic adaptor subunit n=1 Tax=Sphingomonas sp. NPDC019816 TaxID=3390679 RepID=UPI003D05841A
MHASPADETLPETRRLSSAQQWRWVAIAAAVLVGVLLLITLIGKLTHKEEAPPVPPPPGTLRLSRAQLAAMPTMRVGLGASGDQTTATGAITADATRSTPVLMPYAGQVVRVLAEAGQVVRQGQPLLMIKTTDFVDARAGLFSARAAYQNAQAQLVAAQRNADRQQQIYETAGGALKDYQQAKADLAAAQAT